ncbi:cytokine receptor-like factor 3 [Sinocyclocheilus grahami]|uniref:cytokine receptor-like factor 3 n=1 Tax=Sinocyclocheilus grahami TaxID=75366 RepID=UPI0007ACA014|nr:PREDICTED: cytokine receptor-like factor 3 [Sinocyclocheilus grahami]
MSIEAEALLQEAKESIEAAQNYRSELQQRLHGLSQARKQTGVCNVTVPSGEAAIRCGINENEDKLGSFTKKALQIQLDSLPEVPVLVDVPCLSAQLDDSLLHMFRTHVARHGSVASHPPVQIEELVERPGGVLVRWCKVRGSASQTREALQRHFQELQTAVSRLLTERLNTLLQEVDNIELDSVSPLDDCQKLIEHGVSTADELLREGGSVRGSASQTREALQRHFQELQTAVSRLLTERLNTLLQEVDNIELDSVSPLDDCQKLIEHGVSTADELLREGGLFYCAFAEWLPGMDGYILSSRKNIAMRNDSSPGHGGVLYSSSPTYFCGQTLTFKITAAGQTEKRDSLGVCADSRTDTDSLQRDQAVCISTNGAVFVNGKEMTNQLPAITVGSSVTFDMEVVNLFPVSNNNNPSDGGNFKLRVTIGSGNREVVFDWLLDQVVDSLFFGCSFTHPGWKALVF